MSPKVRRLTILVPSAVFIIIVVLPAVHEFGHYFPARLLGGEVRDVTWTVIHGQKPSVSFRVPLNDAIQPWVSAGGILLPSAMGFVLLIACSRFCPDPRMPSWILILLLGLGLSFNAIGSVVEAFVTPGAGHLYGLAQLFGASGVTAVIFQSAPAILLLFILRFTFISLRARLTQKSEA